MKLAILGATGRTGRALTRQALDAGHSVRALVRGEKSQLPTHAQLERVPGDATDSAAVAKLVEGCDVVISTLGPTETSSQICSAASRNVIAATPRRYIVVSGAGLDAPGDQKNPMGRLISHMVRLLSPEVFSDKVRELELLTQSSIPWIAVRPPRLLDKPAWGSPRVSLEQAPGSSVSREDLAAFLLECASDDKYLRRAPFIAGKV